jgi:hypothetical protein
MASDHFVEHSAAPDPTVGACYRHGWDAFLRQLPALLILGLITAAVVSAASGLTQRSGLVTWIGIALGAFVATPLKYGFYGICLDAARGQRADPEQLLRVRDNYREIVIGGVIATLVVIAGLVFLVVPGIYLYCRLQFLPYLLVNEGMDAGTALRESFRLTEGVEWTILGIVATGLAASFVGLLAAGLGLVPALIWWDLSMASLYHAEVLPREAGDY